MGAAIPIMHYTAMAAASFTLSDVAPDLSHAVDNFYPRHAWHCDNDDHHLRNCRLDGGLQPPSARAENDANPCVRAPAYVR
jgi:hypothetical protein